MASLRPLNGARASGSRISGGYRARVVSRLATGTSRSKLNLGEDTHCPECRVFPRPGDRWTQATNENDVANFASNSSAWSMSS